MSGAPQPKRALTKLPPHTERVYRARVVQEVHDRAGGRCEPAVLVPQLECGGAFTAHEVVQRSVRKNSHLEPDLQVWTCHAHHMWIHDNVGPATELGLLRESWEVDEFGQLIPRAVPQENNQ